MMLTGGTHGDYSMKTRQIATIEDLYGYDGKAELVNGEIVPMSPTGWLPSYAAGRIFISLDRYAARTDRGFAMTDNVGFVIRLPKRTTVSPDVAFHLEAGTMKFVEGAPVFAVEVRSEGDYGAKAEREIASKRADYFEAGTQVVWDVDLLGEETVRVYRAGEPESVSVYRRGEIAEAEPALPGWKFPVDSLFPDARARVIKRRR